MFKFVLGFGVGCYVTSVYYENGKDYEKTKQALLNKLKFKVVKVEE